MSFLAEVLSVAEKVELDEINKKVPELSANVESIKSEVIRYVENVCVKYSSRPKHNRVLFNKALDAEKELTNLKEKAEFVTKKELNTADDEVKKKIKELDATNCALQVVLNCLKFNELLCNFTKELEMKNYLGCMEIINGLNESLRLIPDEEYLDIFSELKVIVRTKKGFVENILKNLFTDNVTFQEDEELKTVTLKIRKENEEMKHTLLALYYNNSAIYPLHYLAKFLWNSVFIPVVDCITSVNVTAEGGFSILTINVVDPKKKAKYTEVFTNLKTIVKFLYTNFNYDLSDDVTTLSYIGNDIRDNLSELLIKHCLQDTIPSTAEELQCYKVVIEDTKLLEECLISCKIFTGETLPLFEYANNIDVLFINKKCQEYLVASNVIMKKDLHDMIEVGTPYDPNNPLEPALGVFMQCSVSKNVIELLELVEGILKKSLVASDLLAGRLFCTARNIFTKYGLFVPEYHKKFLQTIPQQVALFHNNCMYISHTLVNWNEMYCSKFPETLSACGFQDEVIRLQSIASEMFTEYINGQVSQINDIMKDAGLEGATIEKLEAVTEKCVRQCLRQQELLKTVWHKVLSYTVYNKAVGVIFNSLCNSFINSIVRFEDISADAAEQLVEVIKLVLTRGPKLFTDPKEISIYVASWYKLNELSFILGSRLVDINDRWANGKGPLALQFKPREVKQLIRALFQNTDRRSAVLANIKE